MPFENIARAVFGRYLTTRRGGEVKTNRSKKTNEPEPEAPPGHEDTPPEKDTERKHRQGTRKAHKHAVKHVRVRKASATGSATVKPRRRERRHAPSHKSHQPAHRDRVLRGPRAPEGDAPEKQEGNPGKGDEKSPGDSPNDGHTKGQRRRGPSTRSTHDQKERSLEQERAMPTIEEEALERPQPTDEKPTTEAKKKETVNSREAQPQRKDGKAKTSEKRTSKGPSTTGTRTTRNRKERSHGQEQENPIIEIEEPNRPRAANEKSTTHAEKRKPVRSQHRQPERNAKPDEGNVEKSTPDLEGRRQLRKVQQDYVEECIGTGKELGWKSVNSWREGLTELKNIKLDSSRFNEKTKGLRIKLLKSFINEIKQHKKKLERNPEEAQKIEDKYGLELKLKRAKDALEVLELEPAN